MKNIKIAKQVVASLNNKSISNYITITSASLLQVLGIITGIIARVIMFIRWWVIEIFLNYSFEQ